jgi:pre-mRNA-splicing factor SYF1
MPPPFVHIKHRSLTSNSTDVNFIASQAIARSQAAANAAEVNGDRVEEEEADGADAMSALERQARAPVGFVAASTGPEGGKRPGQSGQPATVEVNNPDAVDIDLDD